MAVTVEAPTSHTPMASAANGADVGRRLKTRVPIQINGGTRLLSIAPAMTIGMYPSTSPSTNSAMLIA